MKLTAVLLASLIGAAQSASAAETWPGTKPIKFEVGSAAGGALDFVPRLLSKYLSTSIGVPVVVENRPGAGGNIAAAVVAKAEPDGHTLLVSDLSIAVNQTLLPNPGFDYARDLAPVSMVTSTKILLVASPAFSATNLADVIAIAKQKPKSVSMARSMVGSPIHLAGEMLGQYGKIDLAFVPYDSGAQAIPDLVAGRVDLAAGAISTMLPQVRSGALNALAVLSPPRSRLAPDIPTSAEAGLPDLQLDAWFCALTTGGTPTPIIARLDEEIAKALTLPEVRDAFAKLGVDIFHLNPEELGSFLHSETARYARLLQHSQLKDMSP